MDSMQLKGIEKAKIDCAKKLFNEVSTSKVRYHEVNSHRSAGLAVFLIALYGPGGHEETDGEEGKELMDHLTEAAATDEDGADGIDEVVHGIDVGGGIGPIGHRTRGGEQA